MLSIKTPKYKRSHIGMIPVNVIKPKDVPFQQKISKIKTPFDQYSFSSKNPKKGLAQNHLELIEFF